MSKTYSSDCSKYNCKCNRKMRHRLHGAAEDAGVGKRGWGM